MYVDLRVAITGHRTIPTNDLLSIKDEISKCLIKIKKQYQDQSICLLSGLRSEEHTSELQSQR